MFAFNVRRLSTMALLLALVFGSAPKPAHGKCLFSSLAKIQSILQRQPPGQYPTLEWFRFNYAQRGQYARYVDIPFVDLGAAPFRDELIPDGQRRFEPSIQEGKGFSRMVQGQAILTKLPGWVQTMLARRSLIMRGYLLHDARFFADMPTYFLRLGSKTQPWLLDRLAASDQLSKYILERTREMSSAGLRELVHVSEKDPARPVRLFSVGGGPMVDTLNILLKLQREQPRLAQQLRDHHTPIRITLADFSGTGASFGKEVLERYLQPGQLLHGLNIEFEYKPYDWNQPESLHADFKRWNAGKEFVLVHSEGAIGEYGTDEVLQRNLAGFAEHLPDDTVFVASAFLPDREFLQMKEERGFTEITVFPRSTDDVQRVAQRAGWQVDSSRTVNILDQTYVVTLRRQPR